VLSSGYIDREKGKREVLKAIDAEISTNKSQPILNEKVNANKIFSIFDNVDLSLNNNSNVDDGNDYTDFKD
jgi:hypothetical protein